MVEHLAIDRCRDRRLYGQEYCFDCLDGMVRWAPNAFLAPGMDWARVQINSPTLSVHSSGSDRDFTIGR